MVQLCGGFMQAANLQQDYWVTLKKAQEIFGYSPEALRGKINRGQLIQGVHWRKAPDLRLVINVAKFNEWLASAPQY